MFILISSVRDLICLQKIVLVHLRSDIIGFCILDEKDYINLIKIDFRPSVEFIKKENIALLWN
jgi:hypothetical protein